MEYTVHSGMVSVVLANFKNSIVHSYIRSLDNIYFNHGMACPTERRYARP